MSQHRLSPVHSSTAGPGAQDVVERFSSMADQMFGSRENAPFILKQPSDGALVGPYPFFFEQHEAGEALMNVYKRLGMIPNFPADAREVVILVVGAKYQAAYELYAHTNVAKKIVGMDEQVVDAIAKGEKPKGLSKECEVAYDASHYLVSTPGPLPKELWDRCLETFGKEATVGLVHYTGAYAYTCIILNAMDAPVPKESD